MNAVLDDLIVAGVLLASLSYAVVKLGPRTLRKRIVGALGLVLGSAPAFLKLTGVAQRLAAASGKARAACGSCDNCGTESLPQPPPEFSVPVAKISRRV
jgi:hypothetical protein